MKGKTQKDRLLDSYYFKINELILNAKKMLKRI